MQSCMPAYVFGGGGHAACGMQAPLRRPRAPWTLWTDTLHFKLHHYQLCLHCSTHFTTTHSSSAPLPPLQVSSTREVWALHLPPPPWGRRPLFALGRRRFSSPPSATASSAPLVYGGMGICRHGVWIPAGPLRRARACAGHTQWRCSRQDPSRCSWCVGMASAVGQAVCAMRQLRWRS